jgi:tmRNA-binding protein
VLKSRAGVVDDDEVKALRAGRAGAQDAMMPVSSVDVWFFWL